MEVPTLKSVEAGMVFLSVALSALVISVVSACPGSYEPLISGKCTRDTPSAYKPDQIRINCQLDGGDLVSIHSDEENDAIRVQMGVHDYATIGLACNRTTRTFYWFDGTPFDYPESPPSCDYDDMMLLRQSDGVWVRASSKPGFYYGVCGLTERNDVACNDYDHVEGSQTCVALRTNKLSSSDAEKSCYYESAHLLSIHDKDTNDFVAAKAKELGLLDGIHIGLETDVSKNEKSWTDGSNFTFTNFASGFPNDLFGHCTALETHSNIGQWITNSCLNSQLPYVCSRPAYDIDNPLAEPGCPENPYYTAPGTIYSPSYPGPPNATSCEYFLTAEEGRNVQVTFDDLDLNTCCDKVELYEGLGGSLIKKITGEPLTGRVFRTSYSNVMRLSLTTSNGRFVRGFRAHFVTIS